jgi:hypothetical protein
VNKNENPAFKTSHDVVAMSHIDPDAELLYAHMLYSYSHTQQRVTLSLRGFGFTSDAVVGSVLRSAARVGVEFVV